MPSNDSKKNNDITYSEQPIHRTSPDVVKETLEKTHTVEDIEALPEGVRAELIDGRMYFMATPSRTHQTILGELFTTINIYIKSNGGSCKPFLSPFAVYLDERANIYVEPDITVICDKNKLDDKGCNGAPDWIIEIVSPGSRQMDYYTKFLKYHAAGVREYWIVDPTKNFILVYNFENSTSEQYTFSDTVKAGIYEDLAIDFSQLDI